MMEKTEQTEHHGDESHYSDAEEELITSFKKLVLNTSGNLRCIEAFQSIINDELDRLSVESADSPPPSISLESEREEESEPSLTEEPQSIEGLVVTFPGLVDTNYVDMDGLGNDLEQIFKGSHWNTKYAWLAYHNTPYRFGGKSHDSINLRKFGVISALMDKLNVEFTLDFDSCLVTRYTRGTQSLSLHQDDEVIFDHKHPMMTLSIGATREIEFWDGPKESEGNLVKSVQLSEGTLVAMLPGCQQRLWHKVPRCTTSPKGGTKGKSELRYALSFRKLLTESAEEPTETESSPQEEPESVTSPQVNSGVGGVLTSTPRTSRNETKACLTTLANGFLINPTRVGSATQPAAEDIEKTVLHLETSDPDTSEKGEIEQSELRPREPPEHVIMGDSMVNGLEIPGDRTVSIFKGGIHPKDVTQLLPSAVDILHPEDYNGVRTVTLVVGTNALNIPDNGRGIPFLDIVFDYEKLISDLSQLFPNARIGLYNVLPRKFSTIETRDRIGAFNSLFQRHVVQHFRNAYWIRQYWDFVDCRGYLRQDLFGKDGVHLKRKGKLLMSEAIAGFQESFF